MAVGGSGFVGRYVVRRILARGWEVINVDLRVPRHTSSAERMIVADLLAQDGPEVAARKCGSVDAVVWLAASIRQITHVDERAREDIQLMVYAPLQFLEALSSKPRSLTYLSSIEVYGRPTQLPVHEDHQTEPFTAYGAAKLCAEHYMDVWSRKNKVAMAALRAAFIYGPGQHSGNVIPRFIEAVRSGEPPIVYGTGNDLRDDVFVDDVALAIEEAVARSASGAFNVASGHPHTLWEVAEAVAKLRQPSLQPKRRPDISSNWIDRWYSIERARQVLQCPEPTPFERGLAAMWNEEMPQ
ncbi:MAG TPA: NAD-dependent epimerase/dehydratase family protein [Candidatus Bathyarchaeia archaeon]|nr:NAD-dependent epimerase/dehydratase family protein [Candidatus Bathyarchaeia archaeon]